MLTGSLVLLKWPNEVSKKIGQTREVDLLCCPPKTSPPLWGDHLVLLTLEPTVAVD